MARVGLLEDNDRVAKLCATMLNFAGHQVTIYGHPRECLQALFSGKMPHSDIQVTQGSTLPVEVLILDLHLPDITGLEVLHRLQSHPQTRSLPLIFCTAATDSEVANAMKIAPRASLVPKPFKLQTLVSAIANVLQAT
ncbi:MAG TPA: response regulator [Ktedonobacteraceae bacterium]|jgi:CheY-like chemotaxis protein|nr:response regulator [Ktedonobacteraceae bacterium]